MAQYGMAPPAGSLLAQQVLVVRQKLKLVELRNEYDVLDPGGRQIGAVVQATQSPLAFLARLFTSWDVTLLDPRGGRLGEVRAHSWRAKDFSVLDGTGQAIARVTKRWAGLRELFTDADTYVVEVSPSAVDPLRSLAVATCLVIDVVMKQKDYDS